jgi:hypothetical protein
MRVMIGDVSRFVEVQRISCVESASVRSRIVNGRGAARIPGAWMCMGMRT